MLGNSLEICKTYNTSPWKKTTIRTKVQQAGVHVHDTDTANLKYQVTSQRCLNHIKNLSSTARLTSNKIIKEMDRVSIYLYIYIPDNFL